MGKPRLIILVRHAQSEGNKNRAIHQIVPDHRVKLTDEGWKQAEEAGLRLRNLLLPTDTLQVFTSPYRRTRETTEGMLRTLTSSTATDFPSSPQPSSNGNTSTTTTTTTTTTLNPPFPRTKITVYEEPRIREQDFGNFQPCSAAMERMWRERADYGHFFYRIPNGESAADAYDRVAGFNESLWRQFGDGEFPSVCVVVTHGLMARVFLMKWYHWSVEYFEDLRNVGHCEFVLMRRDVGGSEKFLLETQLRTWSELKRQRAREKEDKEREREVQDPSRRNTLSAFLKMPMQRSPSLPARRWGGCPEGCEHGDEGECRKEREVKLPPSSSTSNAAAAVAVAVDGETSANGSGNGNGNATAEPANNEREDHPLGTEEPVHPSHETSSDNSTANPTPSTSANTQSNTINPNHLHLPPALLLSNSANSRPSPSGTSTPHEMPSDDSDPETPISYFPSAPTIPNPARTSSTRRHPLPSEREPSPREIERWVGESGMGRGEGRAEKLGDEEADVAPAAPVGMAGENEGRGKEIGRSAVERLVEEMEGMSGGETTDEEEEREEKGVRGSVY